MATNTGQNRTTDQGRAPVVTLIGVCALLGVLGSIVMTLAHLDLDIPVISRLGPTGRALPPVAAGFAVGAVLFAVTAYGVFRRTTWAWPVALVVNGLAFVSAVMPWRGLESSGPPAVVTVVAIAALVLPAGRRALLGRRERTG